LDTIPQDSNWQHAIQKYIPRKGTLTLGKQLGKGQTAVHEATVVDHEGKVFEVATKPYRRGLRFTNYLYEQEIRAIQNLRNANVLHPDDLVSKVDGLRVIVIPKALDDRTIIMERIQGLDGETATHSTNPSLSPYANGFVDDPQKAVRRIGGLLSGLYSIHELELVHLDIKLENYMIERRELPKVEAKVEARARQMTGITGEESNLTKKKRQTLKNARDAARANLKPEDLYEFYIRLIDMGTLTPTGERSPATDPVWSPPELSPSRVTLANPADDMYRFATTLPVLLFGKAGAYLREIFMYSNAGTFHRLKNGTFYGPEKYVRKRAEIFFLGELIPEMEPSVSNFLELEKQVLLFRGYKSFDEFLESRNQLKSSVKQHKIELHAKKEGEIKAMTAQLTRPITPEEVYSFLLKEMLIINNIMEAAIEKFYPESVLRELVEIMTDCLSDDPSQRPTAKEVLKRVTHCAFSDWPNNQHDIPGLPRPVIQRSQSYWLPWLRFSPNDRLKLPDVNEHTPPPPLPTPKLIMPEENLEDWYD
jgi:serine/threonine protein kinase